MNFKLGLMKLAAIIFMVIGISLIAAEKEQIIEAIKANPKLLESPEAKSYLEKKESAASNVTTTVQVKPVNLVDTNESNTTQPNRINVQEIKEQQEQQALRSFARSPLTVEKSDEYMKRMVALQLKNSASPVSLKRYGLEFFANKNGLDLASLPVPENYKIVPKDILSVILYGPKSDNMSLNVDKDGSVIIPSFGPLHVAGLSFGEAKKVIADALMAAFPNIGVTVNITQFSTIQVTLAGEVATPGLYNVSSFSTVKEALIAAGGLSENGSMRAVQIRRGGRTIATVDLYRIIRGNGSSDTLLKAGDVIVVPVVEKSVVIEGEIKRPAIYEAKEGESVGELIGYAGGLKASANKNDIRITRYDNHEKVTIISVSHTDSYKKSAMDQDKVYVYGVNTGNLRGITLYGNIIKPGFWPLPKEGMGIGEFFKREIEQQGLRGVFLEQTYFDYAIIKRMNRNLKEELIGFSLSKALNGEEKVVLHSRDELYILNTASVESAPIVKISGECVTRPGEYRYFEKMTLESLLNTAGSNCLIDPRNITVISRDAVTFRPKVRVVDTTTEKGVVLSKNDEIKVMGYYTSNPISEAIINGEVYKPGSYPIGDTDFLLRDLVMVAGGITDKASMDKVEIVSYEVENGERIRRVRNLSLIEALASDNYIIKPYDEVNIFKVPRWNERRVVKIVGKVKYPGEYAIEDGDMLADVLERAGGFSPSAYVGGAVFTREELKKRQSDGMERQIKELEQRILFAASQPTEAGQNSADKAQLINLLSTLKEEVKKTTFVGRLAISLDTDLVRLKKSDGNILLKDGDTLYVPEREDSVVVQGEVLNPNALVYNPSYSIENYIERAGGLKNSADSNNIFVVHANGEAEGIKSSYLFGSMTQVGPGDLIVVPMEIATVSRMQFAKDVTSILYQLAVSVAALNTIGAL
ncbi:SLBB domain-containing protein [Sulfuricurvum sp. RIFCSPLOWO2_12_FULL_43_24]|uniref:SLBB domain-containing protein n=1 Tax=Sulfuricurvum sp. RIFCSPLOWO2_12_FULL_43_24 TaxID=1802247 RepID=UPI0008BBC843|nr:SLBB domain-containing protein [Sulfuricurvum sp. RIFCSPLOWO2_12_FULL_43_24]OHD90702.1 MAG: hypothetical protein A3G19_04135 [Sulfuricurvum sp. RIFCSPLOWO2_12_FULL_43_24]